jgi:fused signal recognition particle receptor
MIPPVIPLALSATDAVGAAVVLALVVLVAAAALRLARKRRAGAPPPAATGPAAASGRPTSPAAPAAPPTPGPADVEAGRMAAAHAARQAAAARAAAERGALDEEAKKEAYRLQKEQERLEKERRRQEREEAERLEREAAARTAAEAEARRQAEAEAQRRKAEAEAGKTLAAGLEKTRGGFMARLNALLGGGRQLDDSVLADLEEVLFTADIGVKTATRLLEAVRDQVRSRALADPAAVKAALKAEIARILALDGAATRPFAPGAERPWVVMVVGVNGSGKTTTIGKLAAKLKGQGHAVLLGAGDTFRAAAGEQLEIWAERVAAPIVRGKDGADPASVCFEAVQQGAASRADVVLCDTAGRLHTKAPLMEELKKVKRVIGKAVPGAPHEVLLVLDATSGQNAIAQARQFHDALGVTGLALTKLDGTAKGGVVIGITDELKLPVRWVGVGETVADLKPFAAAAFVEALFE